MKLKKYIAAAICTISIFQTIGLQSIFALENTPPKIENTGNDQVEQFLNQEIEKNNQNKEDEEKQISTHTSFEETFRNEEKLSFVITIETVQASTQIQKLYYNINLKTGENLTLKELLGDNFKEKIDVQIKDQIEKRMAEDENQIFFGLSQDDKDLGINGFTGIQDNQKFYLNKSGTPVIVFNQFEIAPGYMGTPEFKIQK